MRFSTPKEEMLHRGRAAKLWSELEGIFGYDFIKKNGEQPSEKWIEAVIRLKDAQILKGLNELQNSGSDWPPKLPGFLKACGAAADGVIPDPYPRFIQGFDGAGRYGLPELSKDMIDVYKTAGYVNVNEHRKWIVSQPFYNPSEESSLTPEAQAWRVYVEVRDGLWNKDSHHSVK